MCRSPTPRRISGIPATHGHRRSKSLPRGDLPKDAGETIAPPAKFREEPLGKPTLLGDDGFLMQVGTLSGNPVAAAAGLATLEILKRPGAYERIFATGRELMGALAELLKANGVTAQVTGEPPLFDAVFSGEPVRDYRGALRGDAEMPRRFNALLRDRGVLKGEQKYYVSLAHTPDDIRHTCEAWASAIEALAR